MNFTNTALFFVAALGTIITYFIIPILKSKLSASEIEKLKYWTEIAVRFYEDNIAGTGMGKKKKEKVLNFLLEKGFVVNESELDMVIDAMVNQLNNNEWF